MAGGSSQTVSFAEARDVAGTYQVEVNDLEGTFKVKPVPTALEEEESTPEVLAGPFAPWLIVSILVGMVAFSLVLYFVVMRLRGA